MRRISKVFTTLAVVLAATASGAPRVQAETVARAGTLASYYGMTAKIAGRTVHIWTPAAAAKAPLVIFSHGFGGCGTQSKFLTSAMASHGFIVIAPDHRDARCGGSTGLPPQQNFKDPGSWSDATYRDRHDDIVAILAALKTDAAWRDRINWSKVALSGHSLGGYTVLGLAGGWKSWKLDGISGVLALSPYCTPYSDHGSLGMTAVPVMYQGGTLDFGVTPFVKKPGGCYAQTAPHKIFVEFRSAGHLAWSDLRQTDHGQIVEYSLEFLDHAFGRTVGPYVRMDGVTALWQR